MDKSENARSAGAFERLYKNAQAILNSSGDGVIGLDLKGNHTFVNPAAAKMLGHSAEEMIGKHSHSLWHHTKADNTPYPKEECPIYAAYKDGKVHRGTELFWKKDGTPFSAEYISTPIQEGGKITGAVVTFRNVTEQIRHREELESARADLERTVDEQTRELQAANKALQQDIVERGKTEAALRKSEERYRTVIENSNDLIWMVNARGDLTYVNTRAAEAGGYRPEEIIGRNYSLGIAQKDIQRIADINLKALSGQSSQYVVDIRTKTGSLITLSVNNTPIYENGEIVGTASFGRDITEQRNAEEALRKSEERYRTMIEHSNDMIWIIDTQGRFTFFNKRAEELSGWKLNDWEGKTFAPLIVEEAMPRTMEAFRRTMAGESLRWETKVRRPDGRVTLLAINTAPLYSGGKVTGTVSFGRDITEERAAEENLRKSEERLHTIIENSNDMIWTLDEKGRFSFFNKRAEDLSGAKLRDWIGRDFSPLIVEEDLPGVIDVFKSVMEGQPRQYEARVRRQDGSILTLSVNTAPLYADGKVTGTVSFGRDITQQKQAEAELRKSEERYRTIIENSNDMIWTTDREGRFTFFNRRSEEISGYKLADWRGKSFAPMIPEEELPKSMEALQKGIRGQSSRWETGVKRADGSIFRLSINTAPTYLGGEIVGITCFAQDITGQVEAQDEIRRLNRDLEKRIAERTAQLEASNKELESFSYSVSHDLRAPLRIIDSFSLLLLEDYREKLGEEGKRFLDSIRNNSRKMGRLMDDLIAHARVGRQEIWMEETDMTSLAEEVFAELKAASPERAIELRMQPLPPAKADRVMLRLVWDNLLSNAVKFTKNNEAAVIEIGAKPGTGETVYYIKDNGAGFDMGQKDRLFGMFQRLHGVAEFEGTGVGLAIVQRIIQRHKGRVWAEGETGKGAVFYFTLPA